MYTQTAATRVITRCAKPHLQQPLKFRKSRWLVIVFHFLGAILAIPPAQTAPNPRVVEQLLELDLEQLMNLEVTSASRKPQKLADIASAVYIITQDDIRRSGATNIPEVLRLAPGVQVARIGTDKWAITIRGFNARFSNKLLVLMDGRTVYDPLYTGVFWHVQDTVLEDIDRIEVVRGPGAALWGANAVNGIINIITKSADQTQGNLVSAYAGNQTRGELAVRHGGHLGEDTAYRIYAKGFAHDASTTVDGRDANDAWQARQGGFRVDSRLSDQEQLTVQGDISRDTTGDIAVLGSLFPPYSIEVQPDWTSHNYNILTRYQHRSDIADSRLQFYYNDFSNESTAGVDHTVRTFDIDWQQHLLSNGQHDWIWGLGYRWLRHRYATIPGIVALIPEETDWQLLSGFVQDEITLTPELSLTLGAKLEYHETTDWEFQPSARLLWNATPTRSLWAAISRAARTPSRSDTSVVANYYVIPPSSPANPSDLPIQTRFFGNPNALSETVIAYEAGWRQQWHDRFSTDLALFWNDYEDLSSAVVGTPFPELEPVPHLVLPFYLTNDLNGHSYGLEIAANWHPFNYWRLQGSYSYSRANINNSAIDGSASELGSDPRHQFSLLSSLDLSHNWDFDMWLRYVDELPALQIPAYTTLDARLAWSPRPDLTFSLVGQNLLDDSHPEFNASAAGQEPGEIKRSIYFKALWEF